MTSELRREYIAQQIRAMSASLNPVDKVENTSSNLALCISITNNNIVNGRDPKKTLITGTYPSVSVDVTK